MAYTNEDLEAVRQAKRDLAAGRRVQQWRAANGKSVVYQGVTKADLDDFESEIRRDLVAQGLISPRRRTRQTISRKGV
ncbi:MAG: hypothetical protein AAGI11_15265 [Pseudomonadota bacterium]